MYVISGIAKMLAPISSSVSKPDQQIEHIAIDSRQIVFGATSLFFAIHGDRTDGHLYLTSAYEKGVRSFVVHTEWHEAPADANVLIVDNTLEALQALAEYHRSRFSIPVVAITGSNGKTWVKEWLTQLLVSDKRIVKSPRSYNSQVGVALSLLLIRPEHELAIIEAGVSQTGEMVRLERMIRPDTCIITGIGDAHDSGFNSRAQKVDEKISLGRRAATVICPEFLSDRVRQICYDSQIVDWGPTSASQLSVDISRYRTSASVKYTWHETAGSFTIKEADDASVINSVICAAYLFHNGYSTEVVGERIGRLHPIAMRLEMHKLPGNALLINDAYSLDMASLKVSLEALNQQRKGRKAFVILSEMDAQHGVDGAKVVDLLKEYRVDGVFGIDIRNEALLEGFSSSAFYGEIDEFLSAQPWVGLGNSVFLLKGARAYGLERVVQYMQMRTHTATLEIDLNAMLTNMRLLAQDLPGDTKIIAMVKASAYGSGSVEVAKFLEHNNVDMLCVAYPDEGVELRRAGITLPIIVLNPDPENLVQLVRYRLEPEIFSAYLLESVVRFVRNTGQQLNIHLMVDTGMHRLGFMPSELSDACILLKTVSDQLTVSSVFTHLAAADDPDEDDFTREQLSRFDHAFETVVKQLGYSPIRHVLNSYGTLRLPEFSYEAVRLGIGLYGLVEKSEKPFAIVHRFVARVSQVREIDAGESVGYGRRFVAKVRTTIATVNAGYADGLPRAAGNGAYTVVVGPRNIQCPVIGSVCMDMFMIDVTKLDEVQPGDEVEIFGPHAPLPLLAETCSTIPYEILTGIGARIPRVFKFD